MIEAHVFLEFLERSMFILCRARRFFSFFLIVELNTEQLFFSLLNTEHLRTYRMVLVSFLKRLRCPSLTLSCVTYVEGTPTKPTFSLNFSSEAHISRNSRLDSFYVFLSLLNTEHLEASLLFFANIILQYFVYTGV